MKRFMQISVAVVAVLMACATPGQAHDGWGWGPAVGLGLLGLGLWEASYPHYVYPYYPSAYPAPVVIQQPVPQRLAEPGYWYYCQDAQGYYPYVKQCPSGWMKVVPSPPPER